MKRVFSMFLILGLIICLIPVNGARVYATKSDNKKIEVGEIQYLRYLNGNCNYSNEASDGNCYYFESSDSDVLQLVDTEQVGESIYITIKGLGTGTDAAINYKRYNAGSGNWEDEAVNELFDVVGATHRHDMGNWDPSDDLRIVDAVTKESELADLFTSGGSAYLDADIVLSETIHVANGKNVTLCLNDHTITLADGVSGGLIISDSLSTLHITDCGSTVRFFTDEDEDGSFETVHGSTYDVSGLTLGTDYIKTVGGVLYGGKSAGEGGAIHAEAYAEISLSHISLVGNKAADAGGAVLSAQNLTIEDCLLEGNCSELDGGAVRCDAVTITNSAISYNTAHRYGGGVCSYAAASASFAGSEFVGNQVINKNTEGETEAAGGAFYCMDMSISISDCEISDNYVCSENGSAKYAAFVTKEVTMENTMANDNISEGTEASSVIESYYVNMEDCSICGNQLIGCEAADTLIFLKNGSSVFKDSVIADNTATVSTGSSIAFAGLTQARYSDAALVLKGDMIISGNTFCDIYTMEPVDVSGLKSVKDTAGNDSAIAYYTSYSMNKQEDSVTITTDTGRDLSAWFTPVNPDAYITKVKTGSKYHVDLRNRILEQPISTNEYTFKLYTDDLESDEIAFQWYKTNGAYLTEADNAVELGQGCCWEGANVIGTPSRYGNLVNVTTTESALYMYDIYASYRNSMGCTVEAVAGLSDIYKVTPESGSIRVLVDAVRFSRNLVTETAVANGTDPSLPTRKAGEYRCIADVRGATLASYYVTIDTDITQTVEFDTLGGSQITSEAGIEWGGTAARPADPVRDNSVFSGWFLDGGSYDFSSPVKADITLSARWLVKSTDSGETAIPTAYDNGATTTIIKVEGDSNVQAGGLEKIATEIKAVNADNNVKIVLVAEKKTEDEIAGAGKADEGIAIRTSAAAINGANEIDFVAITLDKYINDATTGEAIHDTGSNVIEVIIPYDPGRNTITGIYRYHDGTVTSFINDAQRTGTDNTYYYENGRIHLFTTKFSTYAVAYTKPASAPAAHKGSGETQIAAAVNTVCPQDETCVYAPFADADPKAWYHDGVHFCVENRYMVGYANGLFGPGDTLSRAMIVQILFNMEGCPAATENASFSDVASDAWYAAAISWGEENNVVKGYGNGKFGPDDDVTREQLARILMSYAAYKGCDVTAAADLTGFTDWEQTSSWALTSLQWAKAVRLMKGYADGTIRPTGNATRAEAAAMIKNFCDNID